MTEYVKEIAKVERADFGFDDHGILTLDLAFTGGSWGQSAPGYNLNSIHCGEFFEEIFNAFAVNRLRDIVGKTVYVLREAMYGPIVGFENLPTENGSRFVFNDFWEKKEDNNDN